jgi:FSR family fosmidomycin resistance protein-like MFS transporter
LEFPPVTTLTASTSHTFRVLGLVGSAHFMSHIFNLALPPLFPLLVKDLGFTYIQLGVVMSAYALSASLFTTPVGFLVDRLGGRRVLISGLALQAVAMLAVGLTSSYIALMASFIVAGIAYSVYHSCDYAIISASIDKGRLGRAFSFHAFTGNMGSAAAPLVMVALAAFWDWRAAMIAIGAIGLVLAALIALQGDTLSDMEADIEAEREKKRAAKEGAPSSEPDGQQSFKQDLMVLMSPPILLCFVFYVISSIGFGGFRTFSVSSLVELYGTPLATANGALTGFLVGSSAGILAGGWLADRYGARMMTAAAGFLGAAGLILLAGTVSMPMVLMVGVLSFAGFMRGAVQSTRDLFVLSVTPGRSSGKVFGFVYSGSLVGAAIMPLLYGWVLDDGNPQAVFWMTAGFMTLALCTFFGVKRLAANNS